MSKTANGKSVHENRAYLKATGEEIRSLYQKYIAVQGKDPCAEQRWLKEIGQGISYFDGRNWFAVRRDLHPEYPEKAEVGQCYPVPELTPSLQVGRHKPG